MKHIPRDILDILLALTPNEQVVLHYGDERWGKIERETIVHSLGNGGPPSPLHIGPHFIYRVFSELPKDWRGSLTFSFEAGHWRVRKRSYGVLTSSKPYPIESLAEKKLSAVS